MGVRYPQGGGLTARQREFREQVRLSAMEFFETGDDNKAVAKALRVSVRSIERWRAAWEADGEQGLYSKGPASLPKLSPAQFQVLEDELRKGPAAHGWDDQRWTLARIKTVIGRRFHKSYTIRGVWGLMRRNGWSWQAPARRAVERDEAAIELWKKEVWPAVEKRPRLQERGSCSRTSPGASSRPPHAKTWARRGQTPIVTVRGRGSGRVNIAGLTCYRHGHRSRMFFRLLVYHGRKNEKKGFGWTDYRHLLTAAHQQLGARLSVIWDNARTHWMPEITEFAAEHDWLTLVALPKYAPEINPTEGIWSLIKRGPLANLVPVGLDELAGTVRFALKRIQYRPGLVDGCLAETGLVIHPP